PLFYEDTPWGERTRRDRLFSLTQLAAHHLPGKHTPLKPPIIIASARAIITRTLPRREFLKAVRVIKKNQEYPLEELVHQLITCGYEPVNTVITPGQFARRGGIIDLWPPSESEPIRLEFFGDVIDSLRNYDPSSQRSTKKIEQLLVSPAREFVLPDGKFSADQDDHPYTEFHIPILHKSPASLLDYLPRKALVLLDNFEDIKDSIQAIEEQAVEMRGDQIAENSLPENFPIPYLTISEFQDSLSSHHTIELGSSVMLESTTFAQRFASGPRFGGQLKPLLDNLSQDYRKGDRIVLVSRQAARLKELWSELSIRGGENTTPPAFIDGSLTEGWILTQPTCPPLQLLTDGEIFGWRRPEPRQRHRSLAEAPEAAYTDLGIGDWVVHIDHGVGRFFGLVTRSVDGVERDYLTIEYAEGDQLYVPVHQADRVTKYVGSDKRTPSPTRLGSIEWRNVKTRVKEAVEEVAEDLLSLYAQRQVSVGHAFSSDTPWQAELEA
ncbi:MAG: hypothetical protein KAT29_10520, partial [Anaerolineales bacterium]|nr:hypothetical protein [Anaerolineales bacterium]